MKNMKGALFEVLPDLAKWRAYRHPIIDGQHPWNIPSVKCPVCGLISGSGGVVYPYVNPERLADSGAYRGLRAVSREELGRFLDQVAKVVPAGVPVLAGASLGPFEGRHQSGLLEDFYLYYGLNLLRRAQYDALRDRGILSLGATGAKIRYRKNTPNADYVELHLVPRARLGAPRVAEPGQRFCRECDFDQRSLPDPLVVYRTSLPEHEEIFQLCDHPGVVLATEPFVEGVRSLGLTGVQFKPVEVV